MSGFGGTPFGTTGLGGTIAELPSAPHTTLSSSRKIDPETGKYVLNDDGGFEPMDDVAQRVYLAICFAVREPPIIDTRYQARVQQQIRQALAPMTRGRNPAIRIVSITVDDDGKATTRKVVVYKNLLTNTKTTVEAN